MTDTYKLLAMDLDKTLLKEDGSIPEEVVDALRELNAREIRIALCTGRVTRSAEHYARLIGGASIVSFNGSVIKTEDGETKTSEIPLALVYDVLDFCYENRLYIQLYRDQIIVVDRFTPELETDHEIDYTSYEEVGDLRKRDLDPTPKMVALELSDRVDTLIGMMRERFPELSMNYSSRYVIEIMPQDIDKGYGLSVVAENLGIRKEEVIAVGDSMNDLAMIQWAGLGVAVANADERLKKAADVVTEESMSMGVLEVIRKYF